VELYSRGSTEKPRVVFIAFRMFPCGILKRPGTAHLEETSGGGRGILFRNRNKTSRLIVQNYPVEWVLSFELVGIFFSSHCNDSDPTSIQS